MKQKRLRFPIRQNEFTNNFKRTFMLVLLISVGFFLVQFLLSVFLSSPPSIFNSQIFHQFANGVFGDFYIINAIENFNPYNAPYYSCETPLSFFFAMPFMFISAISTGSAVAVFLVVEMLMLVILVACVQQKFQLNFLQTVLLTVFCCISAPMILLIEQGSFMFFAFFFVVMFLLYYKSQNIVARRFALVALSIAVAMEIFPIIFAVLLLKNKQFSEFFTVLLVSLILFFVPFFMFAGGFIENVGLFFNNIVNFSLYERVTADVSFTSMFRSFAYFFGFNYLNIEYSTMISILKFSLAICIIIALCISKEMWETTALCMLFVVVIMQPVMVYSLVFMTIPFVLFMLKPTYCKTDILYAVLFGIILMPYQLGFLIQPLSFAGNSFDVNCYGLTVNTVLQSIAVAVFAVSLVAGCVKKRQKAKVRIKQFIKFSQDDEFEQRV